MFKTAAPTPDELRRFLERQAGTPFSYPEVGATREGTAAGYDQASARVVLGRGRAVFQAASGALADLAMFPTWTRVQRGPGDLREGLELAVAIRALGLWWLNGARVVYVQDQPRCRAFAYGTLPSHAERGEERFAVEWGADDTVAYELRSFSRPRLLAARLAYPLTRALQRRFVRDSQAALRAAVERAP